MSEATNAQALRKGLMGIPGVAKITQPVTNPPPGVEDAWGARVVGNGAGAVGGAAAGAGFNYSASIDAQDSEILTLHGIGVPFDGLGVGFVAAGAVTFYSPTVAVEMDIYRTAVAGGVFVNGIKIPEGGAAAVGASTQIVVVGLDYPPAGVYDYILVATANDIDANVTTAFGGFTMLANLYPPPNFTTP